MLFVAILVGLAILVCRVAMGAGVVAATPEEIQFHVSMAELFGFVAFVMLVGPTLLYVGRFTARVTAMESHQTETLDEMREMFDAHRKDVDKLWQAHNECRQQFQDAIVAIKIEGCGHAACPLRKENKR